MQPTATLRSIHQRTDPLLRMQHDERSAMALVKLVLCVAVAVAILALASGLVA